VLGVGVLAVPRQVVVAKQAMPAGNGEGHHHAVAALEVAHALAHFLYYAHEFVAQGHGPRLRDAAVVDVQVGPANGRAGDADNGVAGVQDFRVVYSVHADIFRAVNSECFHGNGVRNEEEELLSLTLPFSRGYFDWLYPRINLGRSRGYFH
jgi:hypothetical protein